MMCLVLQINAWFIANRNPQTGEYPDLPPEEEGGSKVGCIVLLRTCMANLLAGR
jgi:hypothetical protein